MKRPHSRLLYVLLAIIGLSTLTPYNVLALRSSSHSALRPLLPGVTPGTVATLVGSMTRGDGGAAIYAGLQTPAGVAIDQNGNLYIADQADNLVREVLAHSGQIITVAGSGGAGYSGDGHLATQATLSSPAGLAVDRLGNLYIADARNNVVRKVQVDTHTISTVAGTGVSGFSGDGGAATAASLSTPVALALDQNGNLYISDLDNQVVRKVDAHSNTISTVAGTPHHPGYSGDDGPATQAQLNSVYGLAVDNEGNLLLADTNNNVIRKVTIATGSISTVAGGGGQNCLLSTDQLGDNCTATTAHLANPLGIAVDAHDNIYVADSNDALVREIDASSNLISVVAGTGVAGFTLDGIRSTQSELNRPTALTMDANQNLYIADTNNRRVRMVSAGTSLISTVAGGGNGDGESAQFAQLQRPVALATDRSGDLYIADTVDNRIRELIGGTGTIITFAGAGSSGDNHPANQAALHAPSALAVDSVGNLYIADSQAHRVREVSARTGLITTVAGTGKSGSGGDGGPATQALLAAPSGLAIDGADNLYIADSGANRIREVNATTGVITTIAGTGTAGYNGDGQVATAAELNGPTGIALDTRGNLYLADRQNQRIRMVAVQTSLISTVAGNGIAGIASTGSLATQSELNYPIDVAIDGAGDLFIADSLNNRIEELSTDDAALTTVAGTGYCLSVGCDTGLPATQASLSDPTALLLDGQGNLLIADSDHSRILLISQLGRTAPSTPTLTALPSTTPTATSTPSATPVPPTATPTVLPAYIGKLPHLITINGGAMLSVHIQTVPYAQVDYTLDVLSNNCASVASQPPLYHLAGSGSANASGVYTVARRIGYLPAPVALGRLQLVARSLGTRASTVIGVKLELPARLRPSTQPASQAPGGLYVPRAHHTVAGPFVALYRKMSIYVLGQPVTEAYIFNNLLTQDFDHLRLQLRDGQVVVGPLGAFVKEYQGRCFAPVASVKNTPTRRYFPQTHHILQGDMLRYWQSHGGMATFGAPISEIDLEENHDGSGRVYQVQWFQNARLERHPEVHNPRFAILLSLLGYDLWRV